MWVIVIRPEDLSAETSTQDEEALLCLAFALSANVPPLDDPFIGSVRAVLAEQLSPLLADSLFISGLDAVLGSPALRSHQRVSVYRI